MYFKRQSPLNACCRFQLDEFINHPDKDANFDTHSLNISLQVVKTSPSFILFMKYTTCPAHLCSWKQFSPVCCTHASLHTTTRSRKQWPSCTTRLLLIIIKYIHANHLACARQQLRSRSTASFLSGRVSPRSQAGEYTPLRRRCAPLRLRAQQVWQNAWTAC